MGNNSNFDKRYEKVIFQEFSRNNSNTETSVARAPISRFNTNNNNNNNNTDTNNQKTEIKTPDTDKKPDEKNNTNLTTMAASNLRSHRDLYLKAQQKIEDNYM